MTRSASGSAATAALVVGGSVALGGLLVWSNRPALAVLLLLAVVGATVLIWTLVRSNLSAPLRRAEALDPLERVAVICLCLGLVTITWNGVRLASGMSLSDAFLLAAGIAWIVRLLATRTWPRDVPLWLVIPSYVIVVSVALTTLVWGLPVADMVPGLRFALALGLAPLLIGTISGHLNALWLAVDCWLLSVGVNAVVGSLDYFAGTSLGPDITGLTADAGGRASGLTTQSNHLAFMAVMALPVVAVRFMHARSAVQRVLYGLIGIAAVLAVLGSGSRGGLVGAVLALLTVPLFQPRTRRRAVAFVAALFIAGTVAVQTLPSSITFIGVDRLIEGSGAQESNEGRAARLEAASEQIKRSPVFGVGYAAPREAHVIYVQLLAAGGLIALAAFMTFALGAIRSGLRSSRDPAVPVEVAALSGGLCGSMVMWLVMGLVQNQLYDRYLFVSAGLIVGVGIASARARPALERTMQPTGRIVGPDAVAPST